MAEPDTSEVADLLRRHAALGRGRHVPFAFEGPRGCLLLASRWTPVPGWNHVIPLPDGALRPAPLLNAAEAALAGAGLAPALYVPKLDAWAPIRKEAAARGYAAIHDDEWMVRDLEADPPDPDAPTDGVRWIHPDRVDEVEAFVDCFARGFESLPGGYRHQLYLTLRSDRSDGAHHCGVEVEGRLVSVASIYHEGTHALFLNHATDPAHRGRGIGSRCFAACLTRVALDGCRVAFFQTFAALVPWFVRHGYAWAFTAEILTKEAGNT